MIVCNEDNGEWVASDDFYSFMLASNDFEKLMANGRE